VTGESISDRDEERNIVCAGTIRLLRRFGKQTDNALAASDLGGSSPFTLDLVNSGVTGDRGGVGVECAAEEEVVVRFGGVSKGLNGFCLESGVSCTWLVFCLHWTANRGGGVSVCARLNVFVVDREERNEEDEEDDIAVLPPPYEEDDNR
jgi:hypothetical protein